MNSHSSQTTDHGAPSHSAGTTASESTAHNAESRYELPPIPGPQYEQVIHYIEQRYIIPGKPGDKLPTEEGSPVEYSEILYLADAYFYEMIL